MAKVLELENLKNSFNVLFEISKKSYGNTFNTLNEFIILSKDKLNIMSRIVKRGKKDSSIYLLLPEEIRTDIKFNKGSNIKNCKISKLDNKTFVVQVE